jgi:hypothetical protein
MIVGALNATGRKGRGSESSDESNGAHGRLLRNGSSAVLVTNPGFCTVHAAYHASDFNML